MYWQKSQRKVAKLTSNLDLESYTRQTYIVLPLTFAHQYFVSLDKQECNALDNMCFLHTTKPPLPSDLLI